MSGNSQIEWTDATWNPVRGCSIISEGCRNCYAMRQAHRFSGPGKAYEGLTERGPAGPRWNGSVREVVELLDEPKRWKRPRRVFVNSMSDLFHAGVEFGFIDLVFEVMDSCRRHTFQVLTKRPEVAVQYFESRLVAAPPNVWLGISAEDQKTFSKRWALLSEIDARTRFVSYEPALGPIGLFPADVQGAPIQLAIPCQRCEGSMSVKAPGGGKPCPDCFNSQAGQGWWPAPNWIIAGSESGRGARPAQVSWFYNLLLEGRMVRAAFFMKQIDDGRGKLLPYDAFPEELQVREFPTR